MAKRGKVYTMGDLHGAYKAFKDILLKSNFDYENDHLYFLGDLADGWGEFHYCLDEILKMKNFKGVLGNHDVYLKKYIEKGYISKNWMKFGGIKTVSIIKDNPNIANKLKVYFDKCELYQIYNDKIFLHGGFNHKKPIDNQNNNSFAFNRQLFKIAKKYHKQKIKIPVVFENKTTGIKEIFIGHSTTKKMTPVRYSNLINIDTGAGSVGYLTLMEVKNKNYIQSKNVMKLY